jgi:hypothetical protein
MGGSLTEEEIIPYLSWENYKNIKNFVETGTYKADTTIMASNLFKYVYTTEIVPLLYENSKKLAEEKKINNITFLLGDSVELLKDITPKVLEGAVFFLDAHQSGSDTSNNGIDHVPLFKELNIILSHKLGPSIFIVDDFRLFSKFWDWDGISTESILEKFKISNHNIDTYFVSNDRFFIFTK